LSVQKLEYGRDEGDIGVWLPVEETDLSLLPGVQTNSEAHGNFHTMAASCKQRGNEANH
jgi:hypothetical protein